MLQKISQKASIPEIQQPDFIKENLNFYFHSNSNFKKYSAKMMLETIKELKNHGVTEALIRKYWKPSEPTADWSGFEKDALIFLTTGHSPFPIIGEKCPVKPLPHSLQLPAAVALQEMSHLCDDQLQALVRFYHLGLRGEHLRNWRKASSTENNIFTYEYYLALRALIEKKNLSPEEAVRRITNISSEEATNIWLSIENPTKKSKKYHFEKQQQLSKIRFRNHYLPESLSVKILNIKDSEGNLLGIYESEYHDFKAYLKKQGKEIDKLTPNELYKAIYESNVKTVKYFNLSLIEAHELDINGIDFEKNSEIITKGGIKLYSDGNQNCIVIIHDKIYVSPKIRSVPGDISPEFSFMKSDEKPGIIGICHASLTNGKTVQFAGSLFHDKNIGWVFEATTGHYGTRPYQLKFLLQRLHRQNKNISIKIIVPKNLKNREEGYDERIVNAQQLLSQILNSQEMIYLSYQNNLFHYVYDLEKQVGSDENYQKFIEEINKVPHKMLLSLQELSENKEFQQLEMKNFPTNDKEITLLRDKIWSALFPILKTVQIASLLKESDSLIKLKYKKIIKLCEKEFVKLIETLIQDNVLPPIADSKEIEVLFWSSNLAKEASQVYCAQNHAINDVVALKYPGKILAGWRSEDLSDKYKMQYGNYLNVLFEMVDHRKKTPFEELKKFFWDAYSSIHTFQVFNSSKNPILFIQDSLTMDNFFMNTELVILRKNNRKILVQEIIKKLSYLKINIEDDEDLSNKIKLFKEKYKTTITVYPNSDLSIDFFDEENVKKGFINITKNKLLLEKDKIEKNYILSINLDKVESKLSYHGEEGAKKIANLFVPTWHGFFNPAKNLDFYTKIRPRVAVSDIPIKTHSINLNNIKKCSAGEEIKQRKDNLRNTNQLIVSTEAPLKHTWLYAYLKAIKENTKPLMGPFYFTKVFKEEFFLKLNDKNAIFNNFIKEIKNNLIAIKNNILTEINNSENPQLLLEAFRKIIIDTKMCCKQMSDLLNNPLACRTNRHLIFFHGLLEMIENKINTTPSASTPTGVLLK